MFYPNTWFRRMWDFIVTMLILQTCLFTPFSLAFPDAYSSKMATYDLVMNFIFLADIIINFLSAYYDANYKLIDDYKEIAHTYVKSWFFVDFISVIPMDLIVGYGSINKIVRFTRVGKIYKLVKITKMLRLTQAAKLRYKMSSIMTKLAKLSEGLDRIMFLMVTTFIL